MTIEFSPHAKKSLKPQSSDIVDKQNNSEFLEEKRMEDNHNKINLSNVVRNCPIDKLYLSLL